MRKPATFYFFKMMPIVRKSGHEFWREVARLFIHSRSDTTPGLPLKRR